jgi:hypothetical protein
MVPLEAGAQLLFDALTPIEVWENRCSELRGRFADCGPTHSAL